MRARLIALVVCAFGIVGFTVFAITNQSGGNTHDETNSDQHHNQSTPERNTSELDLTDKTEVQIDIRDFAYAKPNIRVKKGTKVTWTNQDVMEHNVMEAHEDDGHAHDAPRPDEVEPDHFAGPLLKKGQSYSFTFTKAGAFPYHCAPHPYMTGTVTVVE